MNMNGLAALYLVFAENIVYPEKLTTSGGIDTTGKKV
jgi:hypothetical protein